MTTVCACVYARVCECVRRLRPRCLLRWACVGRRSIAKLQGEQRGDGHVRQRERTGAGRRIEPGDKPECGQQSDRGAWSTVGRWRERKGGGPAGPGRWHGLQMSGWFMRTVVFEYVNISPVCCVTLVVMPYVHHQQACLYGNIHGWSESSLWSTECMLSAVKALAVCDYRTCL